MRNFNYFRTSFLKRCQSCDNNFIPSLKTKPIFNIFKAKKDLFLNCTITKIEVNANHLLSLFQLY